MYRMIFTLIALLAASPASAGFQYFVEFDQPVYNAAPGSSVTVNLQLREVTTDGDIPRLAVGGDNGLAIYNVLMNYATFTGAQATITGAGSYVSNPAFDDGLSSNFVAGVSLRVEDAIVGNPPVEVAASPTTATVLLGTFTFQAPMVAGVTTLQLSSPSAGALAEFFFIDGFENSGASFAMFNYGTATINVVPEPATMTLVSLIGLGFGGKRLLRRRKK